MSCATVTSYGFSLPARASRLFRASRGGRPGSPDVWVASCSSVAWPAGVPEQFRQMLVEPVRQPQLPAFHGVGQQQTGHRLGDRAHLEDRLWGWHRALIGAQSGEADLTVPEPADRQRREPAVGHQRRADVGNQLLIAGCGLPQRRRTRSEDQAGQHADQKGNDHGARQRGPAATAGTLRCRCGIGPVDLGGPQRSSLLVIVQRLVAASTTTRSGTTRGPGTLQLPRPVDVSQPAATSARR